MADTCLWFEAREKGTTIGGDFTILVHAKTYGITFTACGLDAVRMLKYWDRPFVPNDRAACPLCVQATTWVRWADTMV